MYVLRTMWPVVIAASVRYVISVHESYTWKPDLYMPFATSPSTPKKSDGAAITLILISTGLMRGRRKSYEFLLSLTELKDSTTRSYEVQYGIVYSLWMIATNRSNIVRTV